MEAGNKSHKTGTEFLWHKSWEDEMFSLSPSFLPLFFPPSSFSLSFSFLLFLLQSMKGKLLSPQGRGVQAEDWPTCLRRWWRGLIWSSYGGTGCWCGPTCWQHRGAGGCNTWQISLSQFVLVGERTLGGLEDDKLQTKQQVQGGLWVLQSERVW